jgi:hypothetical protein
MTLTDDPLVAVQLTPEGMFAACEKEEHGG